MSHLFILLFISITLGSGSYRISLWFMLECVLPMFSSKSFIASGLIFKYLIYFDLIFCVYSIIKYSSFLLLHVVGQFSQHHWLKRLFFSPLHIAFFVKDKVSVGVWICLWAFYFVPLIYISAFVSVPSCLDDCSFAA